MDKAFFDDVVRQLVPLMSDKVSRQQLIARTLPKSTVERTTHWDDPPYEFTVKLVALFHEDDPAKSDIHALVTLLHEARLQAESDAQKAIDQLITKISSTIPQKSQMSTALPNLQQWDVFISYQRECQAAAHEVYKKLTDAGLRVWQDVNNIRHTSRWPMAINGALQNSKRLILLMTPKSMDSPEVFNEWFYFYRNKKPIHCLMVQECDPHYLLLSYQYLDWSEANKRKWDILLHELTVEPDGTPALISSQNITNKEVSGIETNLSASVHDAVGSKNSREWFSRLLNSMKPSQRLLHIIQSDVDSVIAVDDGLLFVRADLQLGWRNGQIHLIFEPPVKYSQELRGIAERQRLRLSFPNKTKYMITKIEPPLLDRVHGDSLVKIHLSPISYFDIRGVELSLDEPMGIGENPQTTLRQHYFKEHMLFTDRNQLPNKAVIHILVVTRDQQFLVMRRSRNVEFQQGQWSATFEEQMQGDYVDEVTGIKESGDKDFHAAAVRGVYEELGIVTSQQTITLLGICSEYENLAYNIVGVAQVDQDANEVINSWKLHAPDRSEGSRLLNLPFNREYLSDILQKDSFSLPDHGVFNEAWHPTSRIRMLLVAIHLLNGK
jgi:hypothetical protein